MAYDNGNIFAKILRGEAAAEKVYEDDSVLAFPDINPKTPVHLLVIPKGAYVDFDDFARNAEPGEVAHFFATVARIAREKGLAEAGYRIVSNNGRDAGQIVPHFHVHIMGGKRIEEGTMARGLSD
jgi:diadenosine tetraphosphate (Ap4A) HIT family hydrolase